MTCQHLIIDAQMLGSGGEFILADEDRMTDFLSRCVMALGMSILDGPSIFRGHIDLPGLTGGEVLSGRVYIETSHLNIHTFTRTGDIRFDCYSCKPFSQNIISGLFKIYYPCQVIMETVVNRMPVVMSDYQAMLKEGRYNNG